MTSCGAPGDGTTSLCERLAGACGPTRDGSQRWVLHSGRHRRAFTGSKEGAACVWPRKASRSSELTTPRATGWTPSCRPRAELRASPAWFWVVPLLSASPSALLPACPPSPAVGVEQGLEFIISYLEVFRIVVSYFSSPETVLQTSALGSPQAERLLMSLSRT